MVGYDGPWGFQSAPNLGVKYGKCTPLRSILVISGARLKSPARGSFEYVRSLVRFSKITDGERTNPVSPKLHCRHRSNTKIFECGDRWTMLQFGKWWPRRFKEILETYKLEIALSLASGHTVHCLGHDSISGLLLVHFSQCLFERFFFSFWRK